jgi:hypothetical protein
MATPTDLFNRPRAVTIDWLEGSGTNVISCHGTTLQRRDQQMRSAVSQVQRLRPLASQGCCSIGGPVEAVHLTKRLLPRRQPCPGAALTAPARAGWSEHAPASGMPR